MDKTTQEYLVGDKFSPSYRFHVHSDPHYSRFQILENLVRGKNIIDLGFADHSEMINDKIKKGDWLHNRLISVSSRCLGIDIASDTVKYIKEIGISDVICADIINDDIADVKSNRWDFIILGEILEHIANPVLFLSTLRSRYADCIKHLVITVPNAFALGNVRNTFMRFEGINSDHKYWFTPFTLMKVATEAGITIEEIYLCERDSHMGFLKLAMVKTFPMLFNTVLLQGSF